MEDVKISSFIVKLKQAHVSGWIPFEAKNCIGISNKLYGKLFHKARELNLLRKGKRGYFIVNFKRVLCICFGTIGKHLQIFNKNGSFEATVQNTLISLAHQKIKQQYATACKKIRETKGKSKMQEYLLQAFLNEGKYAQVRISARQIAKAVNVSATKGNQIIHELKRLRLIKFRFPSTNKLINDYYILCNSGKVSWKCEREVYFVDNIKQDSLHTITS